jgi:hypothetical protein
VQVLAGILLPSATVFALLLCNDGGVLGPWVNRPWLNVVATLIVGVLLSLSTILVITTVFPEVSVTTLSVVLGVIVVLATAAIGVVGLRAGPPPPQYRQMSREDKEDWRMPPLALIERPPMSAARRVAIYALSGYLVLAILLLIVKAVELATGH